MDAIKREKTRPELAKLADLLAELKHPEHLAVVEATLDASGEMTLGQRQDLLRQLFQWQRQSPLAPGKVLQGIAAIFGLRAESVKRYRSEMMGPRQKPIQRFEGKMVVNLKKLTEILAKLGHPEHLGLVQGLLGSNGVIASPLRTALIRQLVEWSNGSFTRVSYEEIGGIFDLSRERVEQICRRGKERVRSNRRVKPFEERLTYLLTSAGRAFATLKLAAIARTEGSSFWQGGGFSALNMRAVVTALGFPSGLGLPRLQRVWQTLRQAEIIIDDSRAGVVLRYGLGAIDPAAYLADLCRSDGVGSINGLVIALDKRAKSGGCISTGRSALVNYLAEAFIKHNQKEGGRENA